MTLPDLKALRLCLRRNCIPQSEQPKLQQAIASCRRTRTGETPRAWLHVEASNE